MLVFEAPRWKMALARAFGERIVKGDGKGTVMVAYLFGGKLYVEKLGMYEYDR